MPGCHRVVPQQDLRRGEVVYAHTPRVDVYGCISNIQPPPPGAPRRNTAEANTPHERLDVPLNEADGRGVRNGGREVKDAEGFKQLRYAVTDKMTSIVRVQGLRPSCHWRYVVEQEIHRLEFSMLCEATSEQESGVVVHTKADVLGSSNAARWCDWSDIVHPGHIHWPELYYRSEVRDGVVALNPLARFTRSDPLPDIFIPTRPVELPIVSPCSCPPGKVAMCRGESIRCVPPHPRGCMLPVVHPPPSKIK